MYYEDTDDGRAAEAIAMEAHHQELQDQEREDDPTFAPEPLCWDLPQVVRDPR